LHLVSVASDVYMCGCIPILFVMFVCLCLFVLFSFYFCLLPSRWIKLFKIAKRVSTWLRAAYSSSPQYVVTLCWYVCEPAGNHSYPVVKVIHAFFSDARFRSTYRTADSLRMSAACLFMQSVGKLGFGDGKTGLNPAGWATVAGRSGGLRAFLCRHRDVNTQLRASGEIRCIWKFFSPSFLSSAPRGLQLMSSAALFLVTGVGK